MWAFFICKEGVISVFIGYNGYMTQISRDEVQHLAQLSSLQLTDNETDDLQQDIGTILEYIEQLSTLDTAGVEPTYQVTGLENVWRDDSVIDDHVSREQLLALSRESINDQVKVPKVL
jgi:aspartyl-tRNA(Asn)/glutamyl-tRNA(Gln) amidotransferase subunit C